MAVSDIAAGFVEGALQNSSVSLTTSLTPTATFDLSGATSGGPPNPVLAWLKPTIVVTQGQTVLFSAAPYGQANPPDYGTWLVLVLLGLLLVLLLR